MTVVADLVREKQIIVCCGAGGVGKTTTSAALAVAGARSGRRVLVLTVDPSRRLAQTLGVKRNSDEPIRLSAVREREVGIEAPGGLSAWMLDPKLVSDRAVRKLASSPEEADRLLRNPVYGQVTQMIAGMQEYTAMEALHGFVERGDYDLVVLDTPPSRNALNFLEAPGRLAEFLDGRIFQLFLPRREGVLLGTTRKLVGLVLGGVFGRQFYSDLTTFFGSFSGLFSILNGNARRMSERLRSDDVAFLLVTSPVREAMVDAFWFDDRIRQLGLPLGGFVLNRSVAGNAERRQPDASLLPADPSPHHHAALEKLLRLSEKERRRVDQDRDLLDALRDRAGDRVPVLAIPEIGDGVDDLPGLAGLAGHLLNGA